MDATPERAATISREGRTEAAPRIELDADACYRAVVARDPRFDGAFFVGVKTTGIYCRPICPARTPGRDRCTFYARAALAEKAGFRACFRCRPERAPGVASVDAVSRLVAAATARIDEGALNDGGVEELAASLGVGGRHLRRAMQEELGIGPVELAQSRRIALARELLLGTTMPITQIAFASGFSSVRRFNDAFRLSQRVTPTEVRRPTHDRPRVASLAFELDGPRVVLDVRPPFDPAPAFAFLRARRIVGSEAFAGATYLRATAIGDRVGLVAVSPAVGRNAIVVQVSPSLAPSVMAIAARVRRMFDTNADPTIIGAHLSRDPLLKKLVAARPALRVPGAFEPFEWAIRAVLGQQISVRAALTLGGRLVAKLGVPISPNAPNAPDALPTQAFPSAARIAEASEATILALGLTKARARTLRGLAIAVTDGKLVLDRTTDPETMRAALLALPGIGPWTADYIAMRALGWPDAFPSGDLGLRKALGGISTAEIEKRSERWRPWRAYAAAHLWMGTSETEQTEQTEQET